MSKIIYESEAVRILSNGRIITKDKSKATKKDAEICIKTAQDLLEKFESEKSKFNCSTCDHKPESFPGYCHVLKDYWIAFCEANNNCVAWVNYND